MDIENYNLLLFPSSRESKTETAADATLAVNFFSLHLFLCLLEGENKSRILWLKTVSQGNELMMTAYLLQIKYRTHKSQYTTKALKWLPSFYSKVVFILLFFALLMQQQYQKQNCPCRFVLPSLPYFHLLQGTFIHRHQASSKVIRKQGYHKPSYKM